jgi:hypothetical protein
LSSAGRTCSHIRHTNDASACEDDAADALLCRVVYCCCSVITRLCDATQQQLVRLYKPHLLQPGQCCLHLSIIAASSLSRCLAIVSRCTATVGRASSTCSTAVTPAHAAGCVAEQG